MLANLADLAPTTVTLAETHGVAPASPPRFRGIERALQIVTEVPAAILVVVEICVLLTGVIFRYVIERPLVWTDELASTLFLWLAMLGAVVALRRGNHMRLTAISARFGDTWRARLDALSAVVVALFVLQIVSPAFEYASDQWSIISPALEIHDTYRAVALLVGAVLMLAVSFLRLAERTRVSEFVFCLSAVAIIGGGLWLGNDWLQNIGNYNLVFFFGILVTALVLVGCPIAFAFGLATMAYLSMMTDIPLSVVVSRMDEGMSTLVLLAVPLFVFLGLLIEITGLARVLVELMASLVGHLRGGLSYVLLGGMYLVSGISGSKAADMAALVPVLFPEMRKRGVKDGELIGLLSSSGAMAETIPPSIVLITVGSVTGVSIAGLFSGGLMPATLGALALALVAYFRASKDDAAKVTRATWAYRGRAFIVALPALILPVLIRWAVVEGVATATEVSTIGIVYTLLATLLIYRRCDWGRVVPALIETASLSGAILLILGTATAMAWALTQSGFSSDLAALMAKVPGGAGGYMAISVLVFAILGSVLEGIPAIVLFGPLLFPIAASFGINMVHYAIVVVLSMGLGLFSPPLGVGFYTACAIGKVDPSQAMRACWPYIGALFVAVVLVAAVPWFSVPK